jgi:adenosylhomocysteinase
MRKSVEEFALRDGRRLYVLGEGRLFNEGHPASVMDMSFANHALCIQYLVANRGKLEKGVFPVPEAIDREVARMKLDSMGVKIDRLTPEQERYLGGRSAGA